MLEIEALTKKETEEVDVSQCSVSVTIFSQLNDEIAYFYISKRITFGF